VTAEAELPAAAEAWIAGDPDAGDRAELRALLDRAFPGDGSGGGDGAGGGPGADGRSGAGGDAARAELRDRFAGRLHFGTAGLRGAVAAGPNRMNRAVVRAATAAVAGWLLGPDPRSGAGGVSEGDGDSGASKLGVVVGCDARHRSAEFAAEVAGVM
jgi:phosphomannomutase